MLSLIATARKRASKFSAAVLSLNLILSPLVATGLFTVVPVAYAAAGVTAASGGSAIDSSTVGGAYTTLTGPIITEGALGDIGGPNKTLILNAPAGFEFDTSASNVTATVTNGACSGGGNKTVQLNGGLSTQTVTPTTSTITIDIKQASTGVVTCKATLTYTGIKVRPTAAAPLASGNITKSGTSTISGVSGSTNFGTLTEVAASTPPKLTVTKVVVNNNGGTKVVGNFDIKVGAASVTSGVQNSYTAGTYTVGEVADSGYAATISGNCAANGSITMSDNNVYSCTITNDDIAPKLTVTKVVVNDDGGTKVVGNFTVQLDASTVTSGTQNTTTIGAHTVSEIADAGYTGTISGDCAANGSITLALGDVKTCTITNDDIPPTLTLIKQVTNNNGGTKMVADFPLFINGNAVTSGNPVTLSGGLYTASETSDPGYQPSDWTGHCATNGTITLLPGESKTCTVTNDDISAQITVNVTVTNDNGGTMTGSSVTPTIDASAVIDGVANPVLVGGHTIGANALAGYTMVIGGNCAADGTITVALADSKSCSITYDDIQPLLTVTKVVVNDDGGSKVVANFPLFVDAAPVSSGVQGGFTVGSYTVSETADAGYAATISGDCNGSGSITLALGDVKSCTITNDDIAPTLTVTKVVVNNNGGVSIVTDLYFPIPHHSSRSCPGYGTTRIVL